MDQAIVKGKVTSHSNIARVPSQPLLGSSRTLTSIILREILTIAFIMTTGTHSQR